MEFYLQVVHPFFGEITSEIYTGSKEEYIKIRKEIVNNSNRLDFYTKDDGYIIIPSEVMQNSLVYLKMVEDDNNKKKKK